MERVSDSSTKCGASWTCPTSPSVLPVVDLDLGIGAFPDREDAFPRGKRKGNIRKYANGRIAVVPLSPTREAYRTRARVTVAEQRKQEIDKGGVRSSGWYGRPRRPRGNMGGGCSPCRSMGLIQRNRANNGGMGDESTH